MAIALSRYVDITSGVGAGNNVSTRSLSGLVVTGNPLAPSGQFLTFSSAADVGTYFGTSSEEYARAVFYFGWVSKNIRSPRALNFWSWNDNSAAGSKIFGKPQAFSLSTFTAISAGRFTLTLGGFTNTLTNINCSAAGTLAAVAGIVQTAVRAYSAGGTAWTAATVTYDATRGCFNLASGATGADTVAVAAGVSNDLAGPLGWLTGAILSNGTAAQSVSDNLDALIQVSNNFGSFCHASALSLTLSQAQEAAAWNDSLDPNIQFMYSIRVTAANASAWSAALIQTGGSTMTLAPLANEYPEMCPMMIMAATDYTARNSVQNYMFQSFALTPSVATDADADTYDALRINYYGQTQTAGQFLAFYQRGLIFGLAVDPSDQNVYANEIWLKDACGAAIMTLLLSLSQLPANNAGLAQLQATLQSVIDQAVFNGTISVGKPLNSTQKIYITNATGDPNAWQQVQTIGYWVGCTLQPYVEGGVTQWKAVYTLLYSKDDVIRKVEGSDILI